MEFLLFLTPPAKDLYHLLSQKIKIVENTPVCRKYDIYGWFDPNAKSLTFCTDRIKAGPDVKYYINETMFHEATHAAQFCKGNRREIVPFGISSDDMPLSERRINDLKSSIAINPTGGKVEHEAFWMEDKPEKVNYVVQKYCF